MSTPRKRPNRKKRVKNPNKARNGDNNLFVRLSKTEEGREKLRELRRQSIERNPDAKRWRTCGVPDGHTAKEMVVLRAKAYEEAEKIIKIMEDEKLIPVPTDAETADDAGMAREALKEVIVIMRTPGDARNKLSAARTVLEYTRPKPATSANVALGTAEDFLAALLAKDKAEK